MFHAKNCSLRIGNTDMDYVSFGYGEKPFVMLPGLSDALKTVKGTAFPLSLMYRTFAKDYKVFVFSRKNQLSPTYTIREMADDQAQAMALLGISKAYVMGVSQGGMIAMHLAAEHPALVDKLVLANTSAKSNETMQRVIGNWLRLAADNDFKNLFIDTAENIYSEKRLRTYRLMYPILAAASKPKSLTRFIIQAKACLAHDACAELKMIQCPTLVIGGECDRIVGTDTARELADEIPTSKLVICNGLGHGAYEEDPAFNTRIAQFLKS